jgi:hypothetical protein
VSSETHVPWNELVDFENGTLSPAEVRIGRGRKVGFSKSINAPLARNLVRGEMDFGASLDILADFVQL